METNSTFEFSSIQGTMNGMNVSNTTPSSNMNEPRPTVAQFDLFRQVKFYFLAFIIPLGILFNLLSCTIFLRSRMRKSATVFYFFALACADIIVLLGELIMWLNSETKAYGSTLGLRFMHDTDAMCKLVHFLRYFGRLYSSWLVVAICIERFIMVTYPLKTTWSSTVLKALIVILGLVVISAFLSSPAFFAVGTMAKRGTTACILHKDYRGFYSVWVLFVLIFGELVIPSVIVIIFTTLIIIKLIKAKEERLYTKEGQEKAPRNHREKQPTMALLAVSIAFVTLRVPYVFCYPIYIKKYDIFGKNMSHWKRLELQGAYDITYTLAVLNYAINFLLYIVTGKTFRSEFKRFLCCQQSKLGPSWSLSYSMTSQTTSMRRFSNSDILRVRHTLDDKNGIGNYHTKYTPVRQNSRV